jgi:hypothetical protein
MVDQVVAEDIGMEHSDVMLAQEFPDKDIMEEDILMEDTLAEEVAAAPDLLAFLCTVRPVYLLFVVVPDHITIIIIPMQVVEVQDEHLV